MTSQRQTTGSEKREELENEEKLNYLLIIRESIYLHNTVSVALCETLLRMLVAVQVY